MGLRELVQKYERVRCNIYQVQIGLDKVKEMYINFYRRCLFCPETEEGEIDYSECEEDYCTAFTLIVTFKQERPEVDIISEEMPDGLGVTIRKTEYVEKILRELEELIKEGKIVCNDENIDRELQHALQQLRQIKS